MGLDVYLKDPTATYNVEYLYNDGITHNLNKMASEAGIYMALWRLAYEISSSNKR